jgi:hypothetical protein
MIASGSTRLPPARTTPAEWSVSSAATISTVPSLTAAITSTIEARCRHADCASSTLLGDGTAVLAQVAEILATSEAGGRVPDPGREVQHRVPIQSPGKPPGPAREMIVGGVRTASQTFAAP